MQFDTEQDGLETVFKDYMVEAYLFLIDENGVTTKDVHDHINDVMENGKSRASIINGLAEMADIGLIAFEEVTGKGGHRRVYHGIYDKDETLRWIADKLLTKLSTMIPDPDLHDLVSKWKIQ